MEGKIKGVGMSIIKKPGGKEIKKGKKSEVGRKKGLN